jgi:hypothetical protein
MTRLATRKSKNVRLGLQALEARDVPAILNVAYAGAEATANGAIIRQSDAIAADQFDTFLRLRDNGSSEEGYNTDARPFQFDQQGDLTVTHSLQLGDIPTVTVNGTVYREFLLHVEEGGRLLRPIITLEELRFFVGDTGNLRGYNSRTDRLAGLTAVWDLDRGTNNSVVFNDRLNGTNGQGDAVVLIPDVAFAGADDSDFVYLYSRFGGLLGTDGGAEAWGVRQVPPPPAGGGELSGYVYFDADADGVREPNGNEFFVPEVGLEGVVLHLTGTTVGGQAVDLFATTDANGFYSFGNLSAGTYTITRGEDPVGFFDGLNTPGSAGGTSQESNSDPEVADMIFGISLGTDVTGTEYNFGMFEAGPPA